MDDRLYWYWLLNLENITVKEIERLLDVFENPKNIFNCTTLPDIINNNQKEIIIESKKKFDFVKRDYESMNKSNIQMFLREDENFPCKLLDLYEPPYGIFVRGDLPSPDKWTVSIVGARRATSHGKWFASHLANDLAQADIQVISGLAEGIDGSAHLGTLEGGGKTYAVLGSGIDVCFPRTHSNLYRQIINQGGVISEYGLGVPGLPYHFPRRNRIISGLSDIVIVVEAKEHSGSLITATYALSQGRDVMAVPGRPDDPCSEGCNRLIKEGAGCVTCVEDVLEQFTIFSKHISTPYIYSTVPTNDEKGKNDVKPHNSLDKTTPSALLDDGERKVLEMLGGEPRCIDDLASNLRLSYSEIATALMCLEIKGLAISISPGFYRKK